MTASLKKNGTACFKTTKKKKIKEVRPDDKKIHVFLTMNSYCLLHRNFINCL